MQRGLLCHRQNVGDCVEIVVKDCWSRNLPSPSEGYAAGSNRRSCFAVVSLAQHLTYFGFPKLSRWRCLDHGRGPSPVHRPERRCKLPRVSLRPAALRNLTLFTSQLGRGLPPDLGSSLFDVGSLSSSGEGRSHQELRFTPRPSHPAEGPSAWRLLVKPEPCSRRSHVVTSAPMPKGHCFNRFAQGAATPTSSHSAGPALLKSLPARRKAIDCRIPLAPLAAACSDLDGSQRLKVSETLCEWQTCCKNSAAHGHTSLRCSKGLPRCAAAKARTPRDRMTGRQQGLLKLALNADRWRCTGGSPCKATAYCPCDKGMMRGRVPLLTAGVCQSWTSHHLRALCLCFTVTAAPRQNSSRL